MPCSVSPLTAGLPPTGGLAESIELPFPTIGVQRLENPHGECAAAGDPAGAENRRRSRTQTGADKWHRGVRKLWRYQFTARLSASTPLLSSLQLDGWALQLSSRPRNETARGRRT